MVGVQNVILALTACLQFAYALPNPAFGGIKVSNPSAQGIVADKFIVVLKQNLGDAAVAQHISSIEQVHAANALASRDLGATRHYKGVKNNYNFNTFRGYSGEFDAATLKAIAKSPEVDHIEADATYHTTALVTQPNVDWGLSRISHTSRGSTDYVYDSSAGKGVTVYVVDTGVMTEHPDFEGRATWGANFAEDGDDTDGNGHGTHCAGTIAGKTWGVSKKASIVAVKVLGADGSGSTSGILSALQWVGTAARGKSAVVSMSLGGSKSSALNSGVRSLVNLGITVVVAAGNDGANAANSSPASEPSVITVGASDENDKRTSWSNYGSVVDIFAPGNNIQSDWNNGGTNTISGTSMACPHVAGLAAYFIGKNGSASPSSVLGAIVKSGLSGKLTGVPSGTVNLLAYNLGGK